MTTVAALRWFTIPGEPEDHVVDDARLAPTPLCGLRSRRNVYWTPARGARRQCARCRELLIARAEGLER